MAKKPATEAVVPRADHKPATRPKLIPLSVWAEEMFGEHKPHRHTLWKWIADGKIRPIPKKVGRAYFARLTQNTLTPMLKNVSGF